MRLKKCRLSFVITNSDNCYLLSNPEQDTRQQCAALVEGGTVPW